MSPKLLTARIARKVPEVIVLFWVIKILTTGMGETTSDFLVKSIDPIIAVAIGGFGFIFSLVIQILLKKYNAWAYWFTVTMVAIFGTMVADVLHVQFGIPYVVSTIFFAFCLVIIFFAWKKIEGSLSIHSITTRRRELFYWATVITTFALGTAAGDMTATTLQLGYFTSGILFGILFFIPLLLYKFLGVNEVFTFWFAYIVTRPLGASFADWIGRPTSLNGLGFGTGQISIVLALCIFIFVVYLAKTKKDTKVK